MSSTAPSPDRRVGLRAGEMNAGEATWNLRVVSKTRPSEKFAGVTNSDLSFSGPYAIQGNYNGYQVWDITNPKKPRLKIGYLCPASQSDVSVYKNLLFVSGEGMSGRLDCGTEGVHDSVSAAPAQAAAAARAQGGYTALVHGTEYVLPPGFIQPRLDSIVKARQGTGAPTGADSAALRGAIQGIVDAIVGGPPPGMKNGVRPGPSQCHDITVYPAIGLA